MALRREKKRVEVGKSSMVPWSNGGRQNAVEGVNRLAWKASMFVSMCTYW
jgi:hypothetical protein